MPHTSGPSAPIGVYDSGVGGLSVLRALKITLPDENFVYVADSANAPYGDRPESFVVRRAEQIAAFLLGHRAKAIVIACNTASVAAAARLRATLSVPVIAMEPAIKPAVVRSRTRVVLVLATSGTIRSASVARLCQLHGADTRIILQACPGLVELVEQGQVRGSAIRHLLEKYMRPGLSAGADTVVLGCTHYAFLAQAVAEVAGPSVDVLEPSNAIARQLFRVVGNSKHQPVDQASETMFYTSGSSEKLRAFLAITGERSTRIHDLPESAA